MRDNGLMENGGNCSIPTLGYNYCLDSRQLSVLQFKVYGTFENPLFLAKDVAEWIEHSNVSMMLNKVDEDEKVLNNVCTLGGKQRAWFLTEDKS